MRCLPFIREWSVCLGEQHHGPVWARPHFHTDYQTEESAWSGGGIDPANYCRHFPQPGLDCSSNRQVKPRLVWNQFVSQVSVHSVSKVCLFVMVVSSLYCSDHSIPLQHKHISVAFLCCSFSVLSFILNCWTVIFSSPVIFVGLSTISVLTHMCFFQATGCLAQALLCRFGREYFHLPTQLLRKLLRWHRQWHTPCPVLI